MTPNNRPLWVVDLGLIEYGAALALQHTLVRARKAGELEPDILLLLEHPPVITLGRRGDDSNIRASREELEARGIPVYPIERGGDVTYHGPGQLVGYPILNLRHVPRRQDVGNFVWVMQEAMMRVLAEYGVASKRIDKVVGVWVESPVPDVARVSADPIVQAEVFRAINYSERKIAAIGARIEGWITFHGFALNVTTDLRDFNLIVPCGIEGRGVTSLELELGRAVPMAEIKAKMAAELALLWQFEIVTVSYEELRAAVLLT